MPGEGVSGGACPCRSRLLPDQGDCRPGALSVPPCVWTATVRNPAPFSSGTASSWSVLVGPRRFGRVAGPLVYGLAGLPWRVRHSIDGDPHGHGEPGGFSAMHPNGFRFSQTGCSGQTSVWVVLRANSGELSVSPGLCVCVCVCACVCVLGRVWSVACIPVSGHW